MAVITPTITTTKMALHVALSLLLTVVKSLASDPRLACNSTHHRCAERLMEGSQCIDGFCTNPFEGGCLKFFLQDEAYADKYPENSVESKLRRRVLSPERKRICNSEDPESSPFCQSAKNVVYSELRIFPQNWDSPIATSWMMQIILSEILNVPATTETGRASENNNFYNRKMKADFGMSDLDDNYDSFQNAFDAEGGDCTIYKGGDNDKYVSCAHVMPELWNTEPIMLEKSNAGVVEVPRHSGGIVTRGWWITKFSIERDPSLAFYTGYQNEKGEGNRQKLAERFKRPTTWSEYCTVISATNCSIPNGIATRAPIKDRGEDERYFVEGSYTGHFRATDENNCTKNENCTGFFMDYPCTWRSYFKQQAYHLGIALESNGNDASGGYAYKDMVDIWKAADATRSDLIGQWWATETTYVSLLGTDSELIKITLPVATESCIEARASYDRCDENATPLEEHGAKEGACGEKPIGLRNVVVGNLQTNIEQNKNLEAAMSPAYDFVNNFDLTELQIYQLLGGGQRRGIDSNKNIDFRHATCKWLADNWDFVARLVPQSHPQTFTEDPLLAAPITITALVISALALAVTSATAFLISGVPRCQSIPTRRLAFQKTAQIEFVRMLLLGQFFIPLGALLLACAPSKGTCIASVWLINVGYTLVLVPTLVRVSALIKVLQAGKKFRRVVVDKKKLVKTSVGISGIAAVFCAIWTGLDPMKPQEQLILTDETNDLGETIVGVSYYCKSESDAWFWIVFLWQGLLLASGSALAFQLRSAPKIVNDSNKLSFMLYSSFMFLVFCLALLVFSRSLLDDSVTKISLQMIESIFWSIDSIVNIFIYFYKFFLKDESSKEQAIPGKFGYNNGQATPNLQPSTVVEREEEKVEETEISQTRCSACGSIQGHHPFKSRSSEESKDDEDRFYECTT